MTTGNRIRKARLDAGYRSQSAFARALGKSRSLVNRWEGEDMPPGRDILLRIAELTGATPQYLMGKSDDARRAVSVHEPRLIRIVLAFRQLPREAQDNLAGLIDQMLRVNAKH